MRLHQPQQTGHGRHTDHDTHEREREHGEDSHRFSLVATSGGLAGVHPGPGDHRGHSGGGPAGWLARTARSPGRGNTRALSSGLTGVASDPDRYCVGHELACRSAGVPRPAAG